MEQAISPKICRRRFAWRHFRLSGHRALGQNLSHNVSEAGVQPLARVNEGICGVNSPACSFLRPEQPA
jgi:hypothetical protein